MLCCCSPPERGWRRGPLATCADVMARGWCDTQVAAPQTSGGSTAMAMARAERRGTVFCARATSWDPQTVRCTSGAAPRDAPVRARCGGGAAPRHQQDRPPAEEARAHASHHTRRVRAQGLCASKGSPTPAVPHASARWPGAAPRDPVRRQARLRPSRSSGAPSPSRRRWYAAPGDRRLGPAAAPRRSRPGPDRVGARRGPEAFGPPEWCGGTGPPRRRRPTCGPPGRSAGRRAQTACLRRPGRRCCPHLPVEHTFSRLVYNPAGHRPGVQVNATVNRVLLGVASPEVSSSAEGGVPNASRPRRYAEEGASIRIKGVQATASSRA
jgi:hypothetical protein